MSIAFNTTREHRCRKSITFTVQNFAGKEVCIRNVELKDKRFCGFDRHRVNKCYAFHVSGNWYWTDGLTH